jgi:hypothetical protein
MKAQTLRTLVFDLYHATLNTVESPLLYADEDFDEDDKQDFDARVDAIADLLEGRLPRDLRKMLRDALRHANAFKAETL